jgi:hypothetical protein
MSAKRKIKKHEFSECLDAAVAEKFPGVTCETTWSIFSMNLTSRWFDTATEKKLKPSLAHEVRGFVAGYSAAWLKRDEKP